MLFGLVLRSESHALGFSDQEAPQKRGADEGQVMSVKVRPSPDKGRDRWVKDFLHSADRFSSRLAFYTKGDR
jgi:hypothetical protein